MSEEIPFQFRSGQRVFRETCDRHRHDFDAIVCWVYGPGTINLIGDFYAYGYYREPAAHSLSDMVGYVTNRHSDMLVFESFPPDPDVLLDVGL